MGVAVDQFGNPHVVGHFAGSVDFGCGPLTNTSGTDAFVVKLDASGACVWSKRAGNDGFVEATDVAIDGAGNVLITGEFNGAMAFGCNPPLTTSSDTLFTAKLAQSGACLWLKKTPNAHRAAIATDGAGNVLLGGYLSFGVADLGCGAHTTSGEWDAFFAKLDASGNCVWSKSTLGQQQETTTDIAVDDLDNLYLTGFFNGVVDFGCGSMGSGGSYDLFAAKVDPQGACVWSKRAGDAYSQRAFGVAVDKSGNVIVTGDASAKLDLGCGPLTATGSYAFVAKLDSKGACLWHKATVSTGPVWPLDVDVDHNASAVITGEFSGAVDFGCSSLLFSGDKAAFIAKYAP